MERPDEDPGRVLGKGIVVDEGTFAIPPPDVRQRPETDLTLSGHTHGGQVRVRDNDQRLIRRRRTAGLHRLKDSQIYITRGIGTVVLPIRFQCPPEISVLELRSAVE